GLHGDLPTGELHDVGPSLLVGRCGGVGEVVVGHGTTLSPLSGVGGTVVVRREHGWRGRGEVVPSLFHCSNICTNLGVAKGGAMTDQGTGTTVGESVVGDALP